MTGIYWYVSRTKVDALAQAYGSSPGFRWLKNVSFKLKIPFAEAGAALNLDKSLYQNVERIAGNLMAAPETASFPHLSEDRPTPFFSFAGPAHRTVDAGAYWVALFDGTTALLLAGSVSNAIGAPSKDSQDAISPSVDPIGAVQKAFAHDRSTEESESVSRRCNYIWQSIVEPVRANWQALPRVDGIAVFGGVFPVDMAQFGDGGFAMINKIVIGSPVYIRQPS
jgi:hypothetical protein